MANDVVNDFKFVVLNFLLLYLWRNFCIIISFRPNADHIYQLDLQLATVGLSLLLQVDRADNPQEIRNEAKRRKDVVCVSALTGEGLQEFCDAVQEKLKVWSDFCFLGSISLINLGALISF